MAQNNPESSYGRQGRILQDRMPVRPQEIRESIVPLEQKDPWFFDIAADLVAEEMHDNSQISRRMARLLKKYNGGARSVNRLYRTIDQVNDTIPLASPEVVEYVIRQAVAQKQW